MFRSGPASLTCKNLFLLVLDPVRLFTLFVPLILPAGRMKVSFFWINSVIISRSSTLEFFRVALLFSCQGTVCLAVYQLCFVLAFCLPQRSLLYHFGSSLSRTFLFCFLLVFSGQIVLYHRLKSFATTFSNNFKSINIYDTEKEGFEPSHRLRGLHP